MSVYAYNIYIHMITIIYLSIYARNIFCVHQPSAKASNVYEFFHTEDAIFMEQMILRLTIHWGAILWITMVYNKPIICVKNHASPSFSSFKGCFSTGKVRRSELFFPKVIGGSSHEKKRHVRAGEKKKNIYTFASVQIIGGISSILVA